MNTLRFKKALRLIAGSEKDPVKAQEVLSANEFSNEEVAEVIEAIAAPDFVNTEAAPPASNGSIKPAEPAEKPKSMNADLNLSEFNYAGRFVGKPFQEYCTMVGDQNLAIYDYEEGKVRTFPGTILKDQLRDFQAFKVRPITRERFPGMDKTPVDFIGIEFRDQTPVMTTRISVQQALNLNAQVVNAHGMAGHGIYYLLKK